MAKTFSWPARARARARRAAFSILKYEKPAAPGRRYTLHTDSCKDWPTLHRCYSWGSRCLVTLASWLLVLRLRCAGARWAKALARNGE